MRHRRTGSCEVGYGKPPKHSQFQPGRSGNPKGRPKGRFSISASIDRALRMKVTIREGESIRNVDAVHGILAALIGKAVRGDVKSALVVLSLAQNRDAAQTLHDGPPVSGVLVAPAPVSSEEWDALYGPILKRTVE